MGLTSTETTHGLLGTEGGGRGVFVCVCVCVGGGGDRVPMNNSSQERAPMRKDWTERQPPPTELKIEVKIDIKVLGTSPAPRSNSVAHSATCSVFQQTEEVDGLHQLFARRDLAQDSRRHRRSVSAED